MTNVVIGMNVADIEGGAFSGCPMLTEINVDAGNSVFSSLAGALFNKNQTTLVQCLNGQTGSYTVPSTVTNIGDLAFSGCINLTNVMIPDSVIEIGNQSFMDDYGLLSVHIGHNVVTFGDEAFAGCAGMFSITIPDSVVK